MKSLHNSQETKLGGWGYFKTWLGVSVLAGQIIGQGDVVDLNLMSE